MIASPEDTILQKLRRYRLSGEASERQWKDALGVIKVQAKRMDWAYLERMSRRMDLTDLLQRLRTEAEAEEKT